MDNMNEPVKMGFYRVVCSTSNHLARAFSFFSHQRPLQGSVARLRPALNVDAQRRAVKPNVTVTGS